MDLKSLSPAALKAAMLGGTTAWGEWGSAREHRRYAEPIGPEPRRYCACGCEGRATHRGACNGVALIIGCEMSVARWVRGK